MLQQTDDVLLEHNGKSAHFVRFYDSSELLLNEVAVFIGGGGQAHAKGIVIASAAHVAALRPRLPDSVLYLDAEETLGRFMVDGWPDEARFRATVGVVIAQACADGCAVHAFGEMVALLCAEGRYEAALGLERMWNDLARELDFALFCAYPWRLFPTSELTQAFEQVCAEHDHSRTEVELAKMEQQSRALETEVARRKEAEAALRQRERELADFVENAAEGIHQVGADGIILWANQAELHMLGYRWAEYVGRHIAEFHVDEPVIQDILARLAAGETLYDQPARLRCKDGSIKHVLLHSNGCFEDGRLRYTRCFTRDATARHERDRMLSNAPVAAALLTGPDHMFRVANRRCCELFGRAELEGRTFLDMFPELRGSEPAQLLDRVRRTGQMVCAEELRVMLCDESGHARERFLKLSLEPLAEDFGQQADVILIAVDVTEHVRIRQELERVHAERGELLASLTAAANAKDEFLAMLGHELRNPLAPIVTALQLMRMRGELEAVHERQIIERQVGHLRRLVDDLMDISRVTRGKIDLQIECVEIDQALAKAIEMAGPLLDQRRHRLDVDIEPSLAWEGDPVRLAQVVSNLLNNAARYTEPGGRIVLRASRADAGWLRISVADNGAGLAPEMQTQVFELFFQGKRNIDRAEGGLGIGLALVKNIVELHGGRVEAHSEGRDRGSEFVVHLPLRRAGTQVPSAAEPAIAAGTMLRRRVLVVDDNVDGAETLGRLLLAHGHEVSVCHDPIAALSVVERFRPDLAVLDIGLPVLDGYELGRRIRDALGDHPCRLIALTGYGQDADRERSAAAGFEQHLVKPINPDLIVRLAATAGTAPMVVKGRQGD